MKRDPLRPDPHHAPQLSPGEVERKLRYRDLGADALRGFDMERFLDEMHLRFGGRS